MMRMLRFHSNHLPTFTFTSTSDLSFIVVYARVSSGYDFIHSKMLEWDIDRNAKPPATNCDDIGGFYDSNGVAYNCMWYAEDKKNCIFGNSYVNGGTVANEACCACGGGVWKPTLSPTRAPTGLPTAFPTTRRPTSRPTRP